MRVIAGEFRSRRIESIPGLETRPTTDRMRETLFSILMPRMEDAVFVDAYAGTGAVGIEAISRGAKHAIFIEKEKRAIQTIEANLKSLKATSRARVIRGAAHIYLAGLAADIVFLDPPYDQEREYATTMEVLGRHPKPLVIVQHSVRFTLADEYGVLRKTRVLKQGDNALSFYAYRGRGTCVSLLSAGEPAEGWPVP